MEKGLTARDEELEELEEDEATEDSEDPEYPEEDLENPKELEDFGFDLKELEPPPLFFLWPPFLLI